MTFEVPDVEFENEEALESAILAGAHPSPGFYHAILTNTREDIVATTTNNEGAELEFTLLAGEHAGKTVERTLWDTPKFKPENTLFAARLGLLRKDPTTEKYVRVGKSWKDAIGAQAIIEVIEEPWTNKKTGKSGLKAAVKQFGIYRLDDPAVKDVPRGNVPATATAPHAANATASVDPWADL